MIVYTGHPSFDFIYESRTKGATYGQFVGICRGWSEPFALTENFSPPFIKPLLDTLKPEESAGLDIDGSGVFHGTPRKSVAEITADSADVFGEYPKNLAKPRKIVPINSNLKTRCEAVDDIFSIIDRAANHRDQMVSGRNHWPIIRSKVSDFFDRYFKEVP